MRSLPLSAIKSVFPTKQTSEALFKRVFDDDAPQISKSVKAAVFKEYCFITNNLSSTTSSSNYSILIVGVATKPAKPACKSLYTADAILCILAIF